MRQSWSKLTLVQSFLIVLVLFIAHSSLNAQIVIKEQILIDPSNPQSHLFHTSPKDSPPNLFLVAPRLGLMQLEVQWASKLYNPIPPGAYMRVTLPETTYTATVNPFFNYFTTFWVTNYDTCQHPQVYDGYMKYSGYRETTYPIELLFIRVPKTGDTLRFVFHDTVDIPATSISGDSAHGWSISNTIPPQNVNCWTAPDNLELSESALSYADTDFAGFRIISSADTIGYGGVDTIRAIAISSKGKEINLSSGTQVKYSASPSKYGGFKKTIGDTVISPVQYSDARNGRVYYISDSRYYSDTAHTITVSVQYVTDTTKKGTGQFVVKKQLRWLLFSQGNAKWANDTLGLYPLITTTNGVKDTTWLYIHGYGCALSCGAMVLYAMGEDVDPGRLNSYLKGIKGYTHSDNVIWAKMLSYPGSRVANVDADGNGIVDSLGQSSPTYQLSNIDQYVNNSKSGSIVQVWDSNYQCAHWVVVTNKIGSTYYILDPGHSDRTTLSAYNNTIYRWVKFNGR